MTGSQINRLVSSDDELRDFFLIDSVLSVRNAPSRVVCLRGRPYREPDVFVSDELGVLKNHNDDPNVLARAASSNHRIMIYGGSAAMGDGARLPELALPAVLERELSSTSNLRWCVINRAIGGGAIHDALPRLIYDDVEIPVQPDLIIFYFGFNEANYLLSKHRLVRAMHKGASRTPLLVPMGALRSFEQSHVLLKQYSMRYLLAKVLKLSGASVVKRVAPSGLRTSTKPLGNIFREVLARLSTKPVGGGAGALAPMIGVASQPRLRATPSDEVNEAVVRAAAQECKALLVSLLGQCRIRDRRLMFVLQPFDFRTVLSESDVQASPWLRSNSQLRHYESFYCELKDLLDQDQNLCRVPTIDLHTTDRPDLTGAFVDEVHLSGEGNRRIAEALIPRILNAL